ncbi:MAG: hypothetical protein ABW046_06350, partial [Actinoplanes sp.]
ADSWRSAPVLDLSLSALIVWRGIEYSDGVHLPRSYSRFHADAVLGGCSAIGVTLTLYRMANALPPLAGRLALAVGDRRCPQGCSVFLGAPASAAQLFLAFSADAAQLH